MRTEVVKSNTTMPTETKLATPKNNKEIHNELLSMWKQREATKCWKAFSTFPRPDQLKKSPDSTDTEYNKYIKRQYKNIYI